MDGLPQFRHGFYDSCSQGRHQTLPLRESRISTIHQIESLRNHPYSLITDQLFQFIFPDLVSLAQQQAGQEKSPELLRTMIDKVVTAHTDQEARDVLLS